MIASSVILVGCGNMGSALLKGWLERGLDAQKVTVVDTVDHERIKQDFGVNVVNDYDQVRQQLGQHIVVFAVKPQVIKQVLPAFKDSQDVAAYVSICAGTQVATFEHFLPKEAAIVRAMPNLPATISQGCTGLFANNAVSEVAKSEVDALFTAVGATVWVEQEADIDRVTAISGSGPAYVFYFIECLQAAAQSLGLDEDIAKTLAISTVSGAANLAAQSEHAPEVLRKQVTSPGGTTEAGLNVLMSQEQGIISSVDEAVKAAFIRALELARG